MQQITNSGVYISSLHLIPFFKSFNSSSYIVSASSKYSTGSIIYCGAKRYDKDKFQCYLYDFYNRDLNTNNMIIDYLAVGD